jgi:hypothetical protein
MYRALTIRKMAVKQREGPRSCPRMTRKLSLQGKRSPPASIVVDSGATLLATLLRGRFVVTCALFPIRIVVVAFVVTLQAVGTIALGTWCSIRILHDGEFRAGQVVMAGAGVLTILLLAAVGTPWVTECDILWTLVWLRGSARSRHERVVSNAGDRTLTARACGGWWAKGRTGSLIDQSGRACDAEFREDVVLRLVTNRLQCLGALVGVT